MKKLFLGNVSPFSIVCPFRDILSRFAFSMTLFKGHNKALMSSACLIDLHDCTIFAYNYLMIFMTVLFLLKII